MWTLICKELKRHQLSEWLLLKFQIYKVADVPCGFINSDAQGLQLTSARCYQAFKSVISRYQSPTLEPAVVHTYPLLSSEGATAFSLIWAVSSHFQTIKQYSMKPIPISESVKVKNYSLSKGNENSLK